MKSNGSKKTHPLRVWNFLFLLMFSDLWVVAGISFAESLSGQLTKKDPAASHLHFFVSFRSLMRKRNGYVWKQKNQVIKTWSSFMYSERDLNPHEHYCSLDFKSNVSTNSTIRALNWLLLKWSERRDLNSVYLPMAGDWVATFFQRWKLIK